LPRTLATTFVMIGGIAAVAGMLTLVVNQFVNGAPELSSKAQDGLKQIQNFLKTGPLHLSDQNLQKLFGSVQDWFGTNREVVTSGALSTATTLGHVLTGLFLVLFSTFFFLRDGRKISRFIIGLLPGRARAAMFGATDVGWTTLVSYVRATV